MSLALLIPAVVAADDGPSPASVIKGDYAASNAGAAAHKDLPNSGDANTAAQPDNTPQPPDAALPCSDHEPGFPSCGISAAEAHRANSLYREAEKLLREQRFEAAFEKLRAARAISPRDAFFATAEQTTGSQAAAEQVKAGEQALQIGDATAAMRAFRHALELDPGNSYAEQRLHDALPPIEQPPAAVLAAAVSETRLVPQPGSRNFAFRGPSRNALENFAALFGITAVADHDLLSRNVRIRIDNVDWETGSRILQRVCKVLMIPLGEHQVLLANDTEQNRRELVPMSLQTFYALGTPQQITELSTGLRTLFELRFMATNPSKGTITVRAPQPTLDAVARFLDDLQDDRPSVMLDIKIFQLSTTFTRDIGIAVPNEFTVFNVPTEVRKLVSSSSFQQILATLQASGQSLNATTILAALLATASSSSSPLAQPFVTFGGGISLTGVTIPPTTAHFSDTRSFARTLADTMLRSDHGTEATLKVGQRYPIITTVYSASTPQSSILSSLGLSTSLASTTSIPLPQFSYEDLGLVLKAAPQVHGKLVSMNYELALRAIGATQANGPPTITNRESKGSISTEDGESVVIAGLVDQAEIATMNGIPGVAAVPVLSQLLTLRNKQKAVDELLIVVTPHITREWRERGIYVPLPSNVPK